MIEVLDSMVGWIEIGAFCVGTVFLYRVVSAVMVFRMRSN